MIWFRYGYQKFANNKAFQVILFLALGVTLLLLVQMTQLPGQEFFGGRILSSKEVVKPPSERDLTWGWDPRCLPRERPQWHGGTTRGPTDTNATELPIPFWQAVPSLRNDQLIMTILGSLFSNTTYAKYPPGVAKSPMSTFKFSCYFPAADVWVPGEVKQDVYHMVSLVVCPVPANDTLALGTSEITEVHLTDWTHQGTVKFWACMPPVARQKFNLTAVATIRDVGCNLEEWFEHLFLLGFEHIFLYDHFNTDNVTFEVVDRYMKQGLVTVFPWRHPRTKEPLWSRGDYITGQTVIYTDALHRYQSGWMLVADSDEFPFLAQLMQPPDVPDPLTLATNETTHQHYVNFTIPQPVYFKESLTRKFCKTAFEEYLRPYEDGKWGSVELKQYIYGSPPGQPKTPDCLPPELKTRQSSQVFRHVDLQEKPFQNKKYIVRRDQAWIITVHYTSLAPKAYQPDWKEIRLHHYWRGGRGANERQNAVYDNRGVGWGELVYERMLSRRSGKLVGLD